MDVLNWRFLDGKGPRHLLRPVFWGGQQGTCWNLGTSRLDDAVIGLHRGVRCVGFDRSNSLVRPGPVEHHYKCDREQFKLRTRSCLAGMVLRPSANGGPPGSCRGWNLQPIPSSADDSDAERVRVGGSRRPERSSWTGVRAGDPVQSKP